MKTHYSVVVGAGQAGLSISYWLMERIFLGKNLQECTCTTISDL
ncbi:MULTISPECIES: hypothetical protein [Cyanophyceae]|nr:MULTISPECIES: hypothetical protein [unclassified Trichocoleus]